MGRPRKPARVLEMSGAFKKNPQRRRGRAAELAITVAFGDPPAEWVREAETNGRFRSLLEIWTQIVAQDVLHVLNPSHRLLVENTCYLMYKIRRAAMGYGKATSGDYAQVKANLAAMGQTPIDSTRVAEAVRMPERGTGRTREGGTWAKLVG